MRTKERMEFTLVELLVVVAVIAILMGLLLPALNTAKETARRSVCASNLHQLGQWFQCYSDDFNECVVWIPPTGGSWVYTMCNSYPDAFYGKYLWSANNGRKIWHCPSEKLNGVSDSNANGASDFGVNSHFSTSPAGASTFKINAVAPAPSRKFYLADIGLLAARPTLYPIYLDRWLYSARHHLSSNLLFFDWHVESRSDSANICRWGAWGSFNGASDRSPWQ